MEAQHFITRYIQFYFPETLFLL